MTRSPLPLAVEALVINTGPLVALGRVDALELIGQLPLVFITPTEVIAELIPGESLGYPSVRPSWLQERQLATGVHPFGLHSLDAGEAAVIQLALEQGIQDVCIDEWRGRRIARAVGLHVTGSLGLLGRAKRAGLLDAVKPWIEKLLRSGVRYHPELLERFLQALGEQWP